MRRSILISALGATLIAACSSAGSSVEEPTTSAGSAGSQSSTGIAAKTQQLSGHLTPEIKRAPVVGRVPAATPMTLTIGLPVADMKGLLAAVGQVSDPKSPSYRKYLSATEFGERFGTKSADYERVLAWARAKNLTVSAHPNRLVATVSGTVADIEPAFNVRMNYGTRPDGTQFFAPDAEPSLDLDVPVTHVAGLENFAPPRGAGGSAPDTGYYGTDFRHAYVPGTLLTGAGQTVGIFMSDGFNQSDIDTYAATTGMTFLPVQSVPANTGTSPGTSSEGTLDIDMVLSMAPSAQVVVFTSTNNNSTAILANMAARTDIAQFTSSWTWYNGSFTDAALMAELAVQGQSFFQVAGDCGAFSAPAFAATADGSLDVRQFPDITVVGGTTLDMNSGASYGAPETVWSIHDGSCGLCGGICGSGGGIETNSLISGRWDPSAPDSNVWTNGLPTYQDAIAGQNGASELSRNVPDVSAQAANAHIYFTPSGSGGSWWNSYGTSEAAPLWAGFMALVNQEAAGYGTGSIGFANPALYAIAASSAYSSTFHDVVSGNNVNGSNFEYTAGTGYDLATGLGSPQLGLVDALVSYGEPGYSAPGNTDNGPAPGSGTITGINGLCIDLYDAQTANGTPVQVFTCGAKKANQTWALNKQGEILGMGGGCLESPGPNSGNGTHLDFSTCNGGGNQYWSALPNGTIQGQAGKCLTAAGTTSGSPLEIAMCVAGLATQQWVINGAAEIRGDGNKCIELPDYSTANGTGVDYYSCNGGANQGWTWTALGEIIGMDGKCLELPDFQTADGTTLDYWTCNGGSNQMWLAGPNGSIRGLGGKCIDLPNLSTANGTHLDYWDCNGGPNQRWVLASPPAP